MVARLSMMMAILLTSKLIEMSLNRKKKTRNCFTDCKTEVRPLATMLFRRTVV